MRILVVDDEQLLLKAIGRTLRDHEVTVVGSGWEALSVIISDPVPFDLVVCDIGLPVVSGPDVYRAVLAKRPEYADRFLFMTGGFNGVEVPSDVPVLYKPMTAQFLQAAIDTFQIRTET